MTPPRARRSMSTRRTRVKELSESSDEESQEKKPKEEETEEEDYTNYSKPITKQYEIKMKEGEDDSEVKDGINDLMNLPIELIRIELKKRGYHPGVVDFLPKWHLANLLRNSPADGQEANIFGNRRYDPSGFSQAKIFLKDAQSIMNDYNKEDQGEKKEAEPAEEIEQPNTELEVADYQKESQSQQSQQDEESQDIHPQRLISFPARILGYGFKHGNSMFGFSRSVQQIGVSEEIMKDLPAVVATNVENAINSGKRIRDVMNQIVYPALQQAGIDSTQKQGSLPADLESPVSMSYFEEKDAKKDELGEPSYEENEISQADIEISDLRHQM